MANSNFIVQNGLSVGVLTIDAASGNIFATTGAVTINDDAYIAGNLTVMGTTTITTTETILGVEVEAGNIVANSGAVSNSPTTGAIVAVGGVGISGNLNVNTAGYFGYNAINTTLTNPTVVGTSTSTSVSAGQYYVQSALINNANSGSADFIAYGDNYPGASNDHGWMDLGFTGSQFSDPRFTITKANDGYLFAGAVAGSGLGGNLVLATDATGSYGDIVFAAGSFYANAEVARFHGNTSNGGTFTIQSNVVVGNISITSNIYNPGGFPIGYTYQMDDISLYFDGVTSQFPITVQGGTPITPSSPIQLNFRLGGVHMNPAQFWPDYFDLCEFALGAGFFNSGFQVSGNTLVLATPPLPGTSFYGTISNSGDVQPTFSYSPPTPSGTNTRPFPALNIMFGG